MLVIVPAAHVLQELETSYGAWCQLHDLICLPGNEGNSIKLKNRPGIRIQRHPSESWYKDFGAHIFGMLSDFDAERG